VPGEQKRMFRGRSKSNIKTQAKSDIWKGGVLFLIGDAHLRERGVVFFPGGKKSDQEKFAGAIRRRLDIPNNEGPGIQKVSRMESVKGPSYPPRRKGASRAIFARSQDKRLNRELERKGETVSSGEREKTIIKKERHRYFITLIPHFKVDLRFSLFFTDLPSRKEISTEAQVGGEQSLSCTPFFCRKRTGAPLP